MVHFNSKLDYFYVININ